MFIVGVKCNSCGVCDISEYNGLVSEPVFCATMIQKGWIFKGKDVICPYCCIKKQNRKLS